MSIALGKELRVNLINASRPSASDRYWRIPAEDGNHVNRIFEIVDGREAGRSKRTLQTPPHRIDIDRLVKLTECWGF